MDLKLTDKIALITGGSKGIGGGITRAFSSEGATSIILDRNPKQAEALIEDIASLGGKAESFPVEMTDEAGVKKVVSEILEKHDRIDIVVNNAGVNDGVGICAGVEAFESSLRKSLVHFYSLVHYALDALIASKGNIINIGSKVAITGQGTTSGYAASKGGINALTREWALDLAAQGIRVNCVIPAEVMTPQYEQWLKTLPGTKAEEQLKKINRSVPLGRRTTTIEEIADTVVFIASPRSSHTTGQILYVDGGYVHFDRIYTVD